MLYRNACPSVAEPDSSPSLTPPPALLRLLRIALSTRERAPFAMTVEEAMDYAIDENPELYDSYLRTVAWCVRSGQPGRRPSHAEFASHNRDETLRESDRIGCRIIGAHRLANTKNVPG